MAAQFEPAPASAPYLPRPSSPRGPYRSFGAPESLLRIHFPDATQKAYPWYWYFPRQQPLAFSFLGGVWGPGWLRLPYFPIIWILQAAGPPPLVKIPQLGYTSLEDAVKRGNPDVTFGRFDPRSKLFWALMKRDLTKDPPRNRNQLAGKPAFNVVKGLLVARKKSKINLAKEMSKVMNGFKSDWNGEAAAYNALAAQVDPISGFHIQRSPPVQDLFTIGLPDGPPTQVLKFQNQLNSFLTGDFALGRYISSIPSSAFFNINTFTTDAYAFRVEIGQLDPKIWNMSVFPPLDSRDIFGGASSHVSGDYSGWGKTPFPLHGPL